MYILLSKRTTSWFLRLKLSYRSFIGTWKYTKGIHFNVGDTLNVQHKFFIVGKHYD